MSILLETLEARKWLRLTVPTASTAVLRLCQLLVIVLLANESASKDREALVAGVGIVTALSIFADSGAANFLLTRKRQDLSATEYRDALLIHIALASAGLALAVAIVAVTNSGAISLTSLAVLGAVGISQVGDGAMRVLRTPSLLKGRDIQYALPDLVLAGIKLPVLVVCYLAHDLRVLWMLPAASLLVTLRTYRVQRDALSRSERRVNPWQVLRYGVTGGLSAFYSQMPIVVSAFFLPVAQTALLTVAYRVVQPLEMVPATLSTQLLPRASRYRANPWLPWLVLSGIGVGLATPVILLREEIRLLFAASTWDARVVILIACSFVFKSGNFSLASMLMGLGGIGARMRVTFVVGLTVTIGLFGLAQWGNAAVLAAATPVGEAMLCIGLWAALKKRSGSIDD